MKNVFWVLEQNEKLLYIVLFTVVCVLTFVLPALVLRNINPFPHSHQPDQPAWEEAITNYPLAPSEIDGN